MTASSTRRRFFGILAFATMALACSKESASKVEPSPTPTPEEEGPVVVAEAEEPLVEPVALWEEGKIARHMEAADARSDGKLLINLGEHWTPYIFSERSSATAPLLKNDYREIYLQLAAGEFPDNAHGERAKQDKYLELYGVMPTLRLLRKRFKAVRNTKCAEALDFEPLRAFEGFLAFRRGRYAERRLARLGELGEQLAPLLQTTGAPDLLSIQQTQVDEETWALLEEYRVLAPEIAAIEAAQARLKCQGFYAGRRGYKRGIFDWQTHEALAEFEKRHRVYGWGFIGGETLQMLRMTPAEAEREAVIRVLTERAMHAAGVIEDGSRSMVNEQEPRMYRTESGEDRPLPNFESQLRQMVVAAFGLTTPESTYAWLESLGEIGPDLVVAMDGIERPEYYSAKMDLRITIDRGDVWYDFPYDEQGKQRRQPVVRRPRLTVSVAYNGQIIPLARFGTTIGGWRSEYVDDVLMWKYKDSPVGERVWNRIAAAPVWVPPESTPPSTLLTRPRRGKREVSYMETGPGYASAYGLVAAYHRKYYYGPDGELHIGGDEGIRTHGSVDYMSIMRRNSHGCHRLHNHIAVRLMSFVLKHRPHRRLGVQPLDYTREFEYEEETYEMSFEKGGYIYALDEPLPVEVLEGRIRGARKTPVEHHIPKFDDEVGAYVMPDGSWVEVDRLGNLTLTRAPTQLLPKDGGVVFPEGGIADPFSLAGQVPQPTVQSDAMPGLPSSLPPGTTSPSDAGTPEAAPPTRRPLVIPPIGSKPRLPPPAVPTPPQP